MFDRMKSLNGLKVLVVDDDEDVTESVHDWLRFLGCLVSTALTLDGARSVLRGYSPAVVLCDWNLDGARSEELFRELAQHRPRVARVLMTGSPRFEWQPLVASGLVQLVVEKPFEIETLRGVLIAATDLATLARPFKYSSGDGEA
jgi:DNA-binding NtrC family response regulator